MTKLGALHKLVEILSLWVETIRVLLPDPIQKVVALMNSIIDVFRDRFIHRYGVALFLVVYTHHLLDLMNGISDEHCLFLHVHIRWELGQGRFSHADGLLLRLCTFF